jgi:hypothetical protein
VQHVLVAVALDNARVIDPIEIHDARVPAALVKLGYLSPADEDSLTATRAAIEQMLAAMVKIEDP